MMKSINKETMIFVLTKLLFTDTIVLHYNNLDTALKSYFFFRDEFYAKCSKVSSSPENIWKYDDKASKEGKISLVEFPEYSQYCVFISIYNPYLGYTALSDDLLEYKEITPVRISRPLKHSIYDDYEVDDYFTVPVVKFPRGLVLEQIITLDDKQENLS